MDHYIVLGLPSAEEGLKLSEKEISKTYRLKALELHPDKRPDDPHGHERINAKEAKKKVVPLQRAEQTDFLSQSSAGFQALSRSGYAKSAL